MRKLKNIDNKTLEYIILGIIFLIVLFVNLLTPLLADDFSYAMHGKNHLSNFGEIINYQIWHYFNWGGRTVAHTIAQIFLLMPKVIFSIFNSLINVLEVYLIYRIARGKKERKPILLVVTYLLLWFFLPVYGLSNIWLIGSCNYLWTTVIILFFIYQYQKDKKDNLVNILLMFLLGIIAGWTNENTSFGSMVTVFGLLVINKLDKKNIAKWQTSGFIGNVIGFAIMILAPGNFVRSATLVEERSFIMSIINRFLVYTENIVTYLLPLIIILSTIITIYLYKKEKIEKRIYPFILGSFFTIYSMLLSPQFPDRAWTGVVVLLIVPIIMLLFNIKKVSRLAYFAMADILVISLFIFLQGYCYLIVDTNKLRVTWAQREKEINELKQNGSTKIEFEKYYPFTKRNPAYGLADIEKDPKHWANKLVAKYYGLDQIKSKEVEEEK